MKITVEISFYPLTSQFGIDIIEFIRSLRIHEDVQIRTNTMSTQLSGEFDRVMPAVNQAMKVAWSSELKAAIVLKCFNEGLELQWLDV